MGNTADRIWLFVVHWRKAIREAAMYLLWYKILPHAAKSDKMLTVFLEYQQRLPLPHPQNPKQCNTLAVADLMENMTLWACYVGLAFFLEVLHREGTQRGRGHLANVSHHKRCYFIPSFPFPAV